jgi:hypothetical protein
VKPPAPFFGKPVEPGEWKPRVGLSKTDQAARRSKKG